MFIELRVDVKVGQNVRWAPENISACILYLSITWPFSQAQALAQAQAQTQQSVEKKTG